MSEHRAEQRNPSAEDMLPDITDLTTHSAATPFETAEAAREALGIGAQQVTYHEQHSDVHGLAQDLRLA